MKEISAKIITDTIAKLVIDANYYIGNDIKNQLIHCKNCETNQTGKGVLENLLKNAEIAETDGIAICQDTGMAVIFVEIGQDVHIEGNLEYAINEGVRRGYKDGYLRASVVGDPIRRVNTGDNTPAVVHYSIVDGENITITVAPKGFGSENMSKLKMLKPADGYDGAYNFILETVKECGGNPCPPMVIGVGIGGTMEKAALMSKRALTLPIDRINADEFYAKMEENLLNDINKLGIGPMGWGGDTTALGINILSYPTHIAGLPIAVNIGCHVTRHKVAVL